jgi:hypothetical protein
MSHYLYTFEKNWADEFDCNGFIVYNEETHKAMQKLIKKYGDHLTSFCFGTNEEWEDISLAKLAKSFKITVITDEAAANVIEMFSLTVRGFGIIPTIHHFAENVAVALAEDDESFVIVEPEIAKILDWC